ncbi:MAG: hypothetical protein JWO86_4135 [Myxococcaceae bacterium]|nr:hypothetical protein [Myxococcaceae bacterium]
MHERVAVGGTASVHLGWLVRAERVVAVKRLHPHHIADELAIARVREEARVAMSVDHPNVVATLGVVRHPGELLAALEYVPGASLAEIAGAVTGGLEPQIASAIAADALRGVHAAHETRTARGARARPVSRDVSSISSGSVLVGEDGRARIIDFDVPSAATANGIQGKLAYAAPEQLLRRGVDARRDVYAASVVLWETLTGRPLFRGPSVETMLRKILSDAVPPPSRFARGVSPELDAIVLRGLARDPAHRFASASAMATALEQASCASADEVAQALAAMDLACVQRRRSLVDVVQSREGNVLHIECNERASKD